MNQEYKGVWTIAEISDGKIETVSYELLSWGKDLATKLNVELSSVVISNKVENLDSLIQYGADNVYYVEDKKLEHFYPDVHTNILKKW